MTKIIIPKNGIPLAEENRDLIEKYLLQVNRYIMEYTYNTFDQLIEIAQVAEKILDEMGIHPSNRQDSKAISHGNRPDKDEYLNLNITSIGTTSVVLLRTRDGWNLERASYVSLRYNKKKFEKINVYVSKSKIDQHIHKIISEIQTRETNRLNKLISDTTKRELKKFNKLISDINKKETSKINKTINNTKKQLKSRFNLLKYMTYEEWEKNK